MHTISTGQSGRCIILVGHVLHGAVFALSKFLTILLAQVYVLHYEASFHVRDFGIRNEALLFLHVACGPACISSLLLVIAFNDPFSLSEAK
jgi:hypothetical protein